MAHRKAMPFKNYPNNTLAPAEHEDDYGRLFPATPHTQLMLEQTHQYLLATGNPLADLFAWAKDEDFNDDGTVVRNCYMRLTLTLPPSNPHVGWVIATGDANIIDVTHEDDATSDTGAEAVPDNNGDADDIETHLLIPHWGPNDDLHEGRSRLGLAINVHPKVRLFTLSLLKGSTPISYSSPPKMKTLVQGETAFLTEYLTRIEIGDFVFHFVYSIPDDCLDDFFDRRNEYLTQHWPETGLNCPEIVYRLYPHKLESERGPGFNVFTIIATGGFGQVSIAVSHKTGQFKAVKRICLEEKDDKAVLMSEIALNQEFSGSPGLLTFERAWCNHKQNAQNCDREDCRVTAVMSYALADFSSIHTLEIAQIDLLSIFYQTLVGLNRLHHEGVMHRDITDVNMVVVSVDPPLAAIIDLGKAIRAETSSNTCLAPRHKVAPEVARIAQKKSGRYTKAIDVWQWSVSVARTLGFKLPRTPHEYYSPEEYRAIQQSVERLRLSESWKALQKLLVRMLSYSAADRPDAWVALQDPCWNKVRQIDLENAALGLGLS